MNDSMLPMSLDEFPFPSFESGSSVSSVSSTSSPMMLDDTFADLGDLTSLGSSSPLSTGAVASPVFAPLDSDVAMMPIDSFDIDFDTPLPLQPSQSVVAEAARAAVAEASAPRVQPPRGVKRKIVEPSDSEEDSCASSSSASSSASSSSSSTSVSRRRRKRPAVLPKGRKHRQLEKVVDIGEGVGRGRADPDLAGLTKQQRNRISAARYRKRRAAYVKQLEGEIEELQDHISSQEDKMSHLKNDNERLVSEVSFFRRVLSENHAFGAAVAAMRESMSGTTGSAMLFALFAIVIFTSPLMQAPHAGFDPSVSGHRGRVLLQSIEVAQLVTAADSASQHTTGLELTPTPAERFASPSGHFALHLNENTTVPVY